MIQREPSRSDVYYQRAWAHAELEHWPQAAADFAKLAELNPNLGILYLRAVACLAGDDIDAYRGTCAAMLERLGPNPNPGDAYHVAWTCALGPGATAEPARIVPLAEKVVAALPPDAELPRAADYMQRHNVHRLLVMENGELRGIVTTTDVARAVAEHKLPDRRFTFGKPQVRADGSWW